MANKPRIGLDYFPMEVDFLNDIKMRKLIKRQGPGAISVYTSLLCNIYRSGYYIRWDHDLPFTIGETTGCNEGTVKEIIDACMSVGLLSKEMYSTHGILTSKGIQERYTNIMKQLKRRSNISEYSLINSEGMPNPSEDIGKYSESIPQRKVKEIKGKEKKVNPETVITGLMDFEKWATENFTHIQQLMVRTGAEEEFTRARLHLFHLSLQEDTRYPITKQAAMAGFERYIINSLNKKNQNGNQQSAGKKFGGRNTRDRVEQYFGGKLPDDTGKTGI